MRSSFHSAVGTSQPRPSLTLPGSKLLPTERREFSLVFAPGEDIAQRMDKSLVVVENTGHRHASVRVGG